MVYLFVILCFIIFYLNSIIEQKAEIDWHRNAKFAAIGAIWVGPYVHFCLGRIQQYARNWRWKIVLDQTLLMPVNMAVVNVRGFLLDNNFCLVHLLQCDENIKSLKIPIQKMAKPLLDQKSWEESLQIWRRKTPTIIINGWLYWTPVSFVLFTCIENLMMRTYVFTVFAFFWQCYLAYSINQTSSNLTLPTIKSN